MLSYAKEPTRQEFLQNSASVFTKGKKKEEKKDTAKLYEEIGRLKVEVDFLKKEYSKACGREKGNANAKHPILIISRQGELLGLSRPVFYY